MANYKLRAFAKVGIEAEGIKVVDLDGKEHIVNINYTHIFVVSEDDSDNTKENMFKDEVIKATTWIYNLSKYEKLETMSERQNVTIKEEAIEKIDTLLKDEEDDLFDLSPKDTKKIKEEVPFDVSTDEDDEFEDLF